jgi:uncharacterized protein (DUF1786 family)
MQLLCIDIGRGTQDILLYDSSRRLENCSSLILPSPLALTRQKLERAIASGRTPLFWGTNMGGFSLSRYIAQLKQQGRGLLMTRQAAQTFNDYPEELEQQGVTLIPDEQLWELVPREEFSPIYTQDVDLNTMLAGFVKWGIKPDLAGIAVAVQDHGKAPRGESDRRFRFKHYQQRLSSGAKLIDWAYKRSEIPPYLTRMQAVAQSLPNDLPLLLMDTGMAAIWGSLEDRTVAAAQNKLIVNIGNGHTLAVYLQAEQIAGLWEHHTGRLDAAKIDRLLQGLIMGELDNDQVFADGGHGVFINTAVHRRKEPDIICLTGPNRAIMDGCGYYMASPYGNMMLTGAYGLLRAYLVKYGSS